MMIPVRKPFFRITLTAGLAFLASAWLAINYNEEIRDNALEALRSITFAFSVCVAASLVVFSNYVRGAKDAYFKRVSTIRDTLEKMVDSYKGTEIEEIKELVSTFALPLLRLDRQQWSDIYVVTSTYDNINLAGEKAHSKDPLLLPRFLIRIEDDINDLGELFIRRVASEVHFKNIEGTFLLVPIAFACIALNFILPRNEPFDLLLIALVVVLIVSTVFELLLIVSYLKQEAHEEGTKEILEHNREKA